MKKLLAEIKKLRKQIEICQCLEVHCEEIKCNLKKLLDRYDYHEDDKKHVMIHIKRMKRELIDKWLFYGGYKELYNFTISQSTL